MQSTDNMGKYLGIPSLVGKDRRRAFREPKEKMIAKVKNWSNKTLSKGGKECFHQICLPSNSIIHNNGFVRKYFRLSKYLLGFQKSRYRFCEGL